MLKFNKDGNLAQNLRLSLRELKKEFGFNEWREALIASLTDLLKVLREYGVTEVYIVGSFVTLKSNPGDLDVCWNTTHSNLKELEKHYPDFFTELGIEATKNITGIHLMAFDNYSMEILDWFQFDRDRTMKGWAKISLFNLDTI